MPLPQPLPYRAAEPSIADRPGLIELITTWGRLARHAAEAAAHGSPDATVLRENQRRVEELLVTHYSWEWSVFGGALREWQAALHPHTAGTDALCGRCRRERSGLPEDLPLPQQVAR